MADRWERALVTGASAGIGEAFARELASRGCRLVLAARRVELLRDLADDLHRTHGVDVEVLAANVTEPRQLRIVEERLADERRQVDLLINNAGGGKPGRGAFVEQDRDLLENQAVLNAVSVLRLTHAAVAAMSKRGRGQVIQISAGVAFYPTPGGATYAASKAFVNSFSLAVNRELDGTGVRVTVVCPGFTRTEGPARNGFGEDNVPRWLWADPEKVVKVALSAAERGKSLVSPTLTNKIGASFGAHFPRVMSRFARHFNDLSRRPLPVPRDGPI